MLKTLYLFSLSPLNNNIYIHHMNFKNFIFFMPKKLVYMLRRFAAFKCKQIKTTFVIGPYVVRAFFFFIQRVKKKSMKKKI